MCGICAARRVVHDAGAGRLDAEGHRRRAVHDDVDPQDLDRGERRRHAEQRGAPSTVRMAPMLVDSWKRTNLTMLS